ncbi:MAG: GGDEF domain-containing protein, partial [Proteobacteria bacterium]|nr:GGDEF domain-containing protein [Pseudomonadota bacterium]
MSKPTQPSEIARDVLRQLAMNRTPPTPDNYMALYHEIAGTAKVESFPDKPLKTLAAALPRNTADQTRFARQFESAVTDKSWDAVNAALLAFTATNAAEPPHWANLIRDLTIQLERVQAGLTQTKKREMIEHVLSASSAPDLLGAVEAPRPGSAESSAASHALGAELQELVAQLLENSIGALLTDTPDLAEEARLLAIEVRGALSGEAIGRFATRMKKFSYRLNFFTEDQNELKTALLRLLQLIIENISELVLDDQLLHGQVNLVLDLFNQPLSLRQLDDAERRMKDIIYKQGALKKHLKEAQDRLK